MSSIRSSSYTHEEDKWLCQLYVDISQDPIIGINQSGEQFWERIGIQYHLNSPSQPRTNKSLKSRMHMIIAAVLKLRGCIKQVENLKLSGASPQDINDRAKTLFSQQGDSYKKGFKFDHVWSILAVIPKFATKGNTTSTSQQQGVHFSQPFSSFASRTSTNPSTSSFDLNVGVDEIGMSPSERPIGVKKAKMKKKSGDEFTKLIQQNERLFQSLEKSNFDRQQIQREKIKVQKMKEENKILLANVDSIGDPEVREYIINQKRKIIQDRACTPEDDEGTLQYQGSQYRASQSEQNQQQTTQGEGSQNPSDSFSQYIDLLSR